MTTASGPNSFGTAGANGAIVFGTGTSSTGGTTALAAQGAAITLDQTLGGTGTLQVGGGALTVRDGTTIEASLHLAGSYTTASFHVGSDGAGGTLITHT